MLTDLIHEVGQVMATNKLRTALTGIAVTWGIFMLVVLLGVARGVTNKFEENTANRTQAELTIYGGSTSLPWKGNREGRSIDLEDRDMGTIENQNPKTVSNVRGRVSGSGQISTNEANSGAGYDGIYPQEQFTWAIEELAAGRFINEADLQRKAKVMLLPEFYAQMLFPPDGQKAVGSRVNCNGLSFLVVGVYRSRWNRTIYIPFTTGQIMSADNRKLDKITVELRDVHNEQAAQQAEEAVRSTMAAAHKFSPDDRNAVYMDNSFLNTVRNNKALDILNTCVWILGLLTLLSGIVGVSNIMFVTVRERTHEIGIRRAIGARPLSIITQVIAEAVAITLVFGYIGIVLGMLATQLIDNLTKSSNTLLNPTVSIWIAVEVTAVLVLAGALAGLFPALKALKVKPVEALRDE